MRRRYLLSILLAPALLLPLSPPSGAVQVDLAAKLRELDPRILTADKEQARAAANMLYADVRARIKLANQRETKNWRGLKNLADWDKYRDQRVEALRKSLGQFPPPPEKPKVTV